MSGSNKIAVTILNETDIKNIPVKKKFQKWINQVTKTIPDKIPKNCSEICISIVDKKTSAALNETYRQKKGATNVLSFTYVTTPGIPQISLGDLAICAEIVEIEAAAQHKNSESHWAHLTIHGILHLLGYDHVVDDDALIMETLEIKLLNKLGYENPYEQH